MISYVSLRLSSGCYTAFACSPHSNDLVANLQHLCSPDPALADPPTSLAACAGCAAEQQRSCVVTSTNANINTCVAQVAAAAVALQIPTQLSAEQQQQLQG